MAKKEHDYNNAKFFISLFLSISVLIVMAYTLGRVNKFDAIIVDIPKRVCHNETIQGELNIEPCITITLNDYDKEGKINGTNTICWLNGKYYTYGSQYKKLICQNGTYFSIGRRDIIENYTNTTKICLYEQIKEVCEVK